MLRVDMPDRRELAADVVVAGAGLAGLTAARELRQAGRDVVVLEARDRVGGRTLNAEIGDGKVVEIGGQWVGPTQDRVLALARDLGVDTFPTWSEGQNVISTGGRLRRYSGTIPRLGPLTLLDLEQVRRRLQRLVDRVDPAAPWQARDARKLDRQSAAAWLDRVGLTRTGRRLMTIGVRTAMGAEPEEMSLLYLVLFASAAGSFDAMLDVEGGAQQDRIVGGSQVLSLRIAEELGESLVLESPVRRIERDPGGVRVVSDRALVTAKKAIVATPPALSGRIDWHPALPAVRDGLSQHMPMGAMFKCTAIYPEPFWRDDGLSGEGVDDRGPITVTFDNSPSDGEPGVLVGFVGGADARRWQRLEHSARRNEALGCFARLFGDEARGAERYIEQDWTSEKWSGGGPVALMGPGAVTTFGPALREPVEPVHWAGTETADTWCGYMDGAVRSGERAAAEVR
jgi:monoamine oxidase